MATLTLEERLAIEQTKLDNLNAAYTKALQAVSWETKDGDSSRRVQNQNLATLAAEINRTEQRIASLEQQIATGKTGKAFRVGVSFR